jgi:hypothetical protein
MSMASNDTAQSIDPDGAHAVAGVDIPHRPEIIGPIIAGVIVGILVVSVVFVCLYCYIRPSPPPVDLEDGTFVNEKKAPVSGRKWFSSKTGRFRKYEDPNQPIKKLSAVPRYLRVFRRSAGWSDQPIPGSPAVPRSARLVAGDSMVTLSLPPSASPTTKDVFNQLDRADRRKVQVAAQPIQPLPNIASPRSGHPGYQREEIVQQLIEKQHAVAELEEKSRRHQHQVHGSIDSLSTTSTCVVDERIEQDITELRSEVKVLEQMLPERSQPPPKYI